MSNLQSFFKNSNKQKYVVKLQRTGNGMQSIWDCEGMVMLKMRTVDSDTVIMLYFKLFRNTNIYLTVL
jgi:hypothetical protein